VPVLGLNQIVDKSRRDNAGPGYCAKGVANILQAAGIPWDRMPSAYQLRPQLENSDEFIPLGRIDPASAPPGAVLLFDKAGDGREGGGNRHGHIEIVGYDGSGNRRYVSDAARNNYGGTVPDKYIGAYLPKKWATEEQQALARAGGIGSPWNPETARDQGGTSRVSDQQREMHIAMLAQTFGISRDEAELYTPILSLALMAETLGALSGDSNYVPGKFIEDAKRLMQGANELGRLPKGATGTISGPFEAAHNGLTSPDKIMQDFGATPGAALRAH
jgi:hypothetical protein